MIINFLGIIRAWNTTIRNLFARKPINIPETQIIGIPSPDVQTTVAAPSAQNSHVSDIEDAGRWYFKRDILDRLDDYFDYMARMKKWDHEAYELFSQVGGYVTNWNKNAYVSIGGRGLDAAFRINGEAPSFGMTTFILPNIKADDGDEMWLPRLIYFQKVGRSYFVEPSADDVYRVSAFYAAKTRKFRGMDIDHPVTFHVSVDKHNKIHLLREMSLQTQRTKPTKISGYTRRVSSSVTRVSWGISPSLMGVYRGLTSGSKPKKTLEEYAMMMFSVAANWQATATADLHVRVSRGDLTAMFCVDTLRTPYFFNDRETGLANDGKRKRILHLVRTHRVGNRFRKSHFRGERSFIWAGSKVQLSMPGKHHGVIGEFTSGFIDAEMINRRRGYLTPKQLGERFRDHLIGLDWKNDAEN